MKDYLLALNKDEDTLSVISLSEGRVVKTIPTDHNPHEIAVSPDGKKSYVTCSLGNRLNVIDNDTFEVVKRIDHEDFKFPHGVGFANDGKTLYIAATYSERILTLDTASDVITSSTPTYQKHSHMISTAPDGQTIFIPNIGSDNITVLEVATGQFKTHFPVGKGPEGVAVHPNGKHLYVANQHDNTLYVIDPNTYELLYRRKIGACPIRIVFSHNGEYALIPNRESGDLTIIKTHFKMKDELVPWEIKRIPIGVWPGGTVINPEDTLAYVANNKTNDISIIDMQTLKEIGRIDAGIHPDGLAFLRKAHGDA